MSQVTNPLTMLFSLLQRASLQRTITPQPLGRSTKRLYSR